MQKLCVAVGNIYALPNPIHKCTSAKNTITSLSLLVWKGNLIHLKLVNFCVGAPFICFWIVDFNCVQEFVAIKSPNCINSVCHRCDASIASRSSHISHHLPLVFSRVIHLHTAHCMGAIKASTNKEFSYEKDKIGVSLLSTHCTSKRSLPFLEDQVRVKKRKGFLAETCFFQGLESQHYPTELFWSLGLIGLK